jgi:hypothetical protein
MYSSHLQGRKVSQTRNQHNQGNRGPRLLSLVSCLAYSSTLKIEAVHSTEMSLNLYQTTRCYISEDSTCISPETQYFKVLYTTEEEPVKIGDVSVGRDYEALHDHCHWYRNSRPNGVALLLDIREVAGSILGPGAGYPDSFIISSSVPPDMPHDLPQLGHDRIRPHPFQFMIRKSSYHSTLYIYIYSKLLTVLVNKP